MGHDFDIEKSLRQQLGLKNLGCIRRQTKFNRHVCFYISVNEDECAVINSNGVWLNDCLIAVF
jgi:hypothetical protein